MKKLTKSKSPKSQTPSRRKRCNPYKSRRLNPETIIEQLDKLIGKFVKIIILYQNVQKVFAYGYLFRYNKLASERGQLGNLYQVEGEYVDSYAPSIVKITPQTDNIKILMSSSDDPIHTIAIYFN